MIVQRKCRRGQRGTLLLLPTVLSIICMLFWAKRYKGDATDVKNNFEEIRGGIRSSRGGFGNGDNPTVYVLLNSYMRSGSSFTGELLGHRRDTFYFYEPLYSLATYGYLKGNSTTCSSVRISCRETDIFTKAMATLNDIFNCNEEMARRIWSLVEENGGTPLDPFKHCKRYAKKNNTSMETCFKIASGLCEDAQYRVTKVLRLATENLEPLLNRHPNLKAIHLFRDPRAVMNSRKNSKWYPGHQKLQLMLIDAEGQCFRMNNDYIAGLALEKKYPHRFKMVLYEDLMSDLKTKTKLLFQFLGLQYTDVDDQKIAFQTDKSLNISTATGDNSRSPVTRRVDRSKNYAFSWRTSLDWENVRGVDQRCQNIYKHFGYRVFKSEEEMRDLTVPGLTESGIKLL